MSARGLGVGFVDANIQGCKMCLAMFAYQGILGIGYNATPALRIGLEGRYYGTTNPGAYFNNNIMALLSVAYKFGQPEVAPPPPPPPVVTPPSFMVFFDWDRSNLSQQALTTIQQAANAFKAQGQRAHHGDRPHRHVGPGELQHGAVAASRQRGQGRSGPRRRAGPGDHGHRQGRKPAAGADRRQRARAAEPPRRDRRPVKRRANLPLAETAGYSGRFLNMLLASTAIQEQTRLAPCENTRPMPVRPRGLIFNAVCALAPIDHAKLSSAYQAEIDCSSDTLFRTVVEHDPLVNAILIRCASAHSSLRRCSSKLGRYRASSGSMDLPTQRRWRDDLVQQPLWQMIAQYKAEVPIHDPTDDCLTPAIVE